MKHWKFPAAALLVMLAAGCSTYKTDTDAEFDSIGVNGLPVIHVGEIEETPDKYTYLGWVEAEVSRPTPFHDAPTEEQADIALALKGQELGADAVVYVSYKSEMFGMKITAKGQAIKLEKGDKYVRALPAEKEEPKAGMYRSPEKSVVTEDSRPKGVTMVPKQPIVQPPSQIVQPPSQMIEEVETSTALVINTPEKPDEKTVVQVEKTIVLEEKPATAATAAAVASTSATPVAAPVSCPEPVAAPAPEPQCENTDYYASLDKSTLYMMRSNAEFVLDRSKDKDIRQAASRLLGLLNQYLAELDAVSQVKR